MKKLLIGAAAAICSFALNAASYSWQGYSNYMATDADAESCAYAGFAVYAFDANQLSAATLAANLEAGNITDFSGDALLGSTTVDGESWTFAMGGTDEMAAYTKGSSTEYLKGYWVVVDNSSIDKAEHFYIVDNWGEQEVNDAIKSNGYVMGSDETYLGETSTWAQVAPEPTSGLLLLIGVAGLALRRRRA